MRANAHRVGLATMLVGLPAVSIGYGTHSTFTSLNDTPIGQR
jgi:hypothetical protein